MNSLIVFSNASPLKSMTLRNLIKFSQIVFKSKSTYLILIDNCSKWLVPVVLPAKIEKYVAFLLFLVFFFMTIAPPHCIILFYISPKISIAFNEI